VRFLERLFGDDTGYLCVVTIRGENRNTYFFRYPTELDTLGNQLAKWEQSKLNVYFHPVLTESPSADAEIVCSPVIAADLDIVDPVLCDPTPYAIVESSPGRFQAYWRRGEHHLPVSINGPVVGDLHLMRLPGTWNWKYSGDQWKVREADPAKLDTFERVVSRRGLTSSSFDNLFALNDRWSLARLCARLGCSTNETYLVLAAAQKALGASLGDDGYLSAGALYKDAIEAVKSSSAPSLLTEDEIRTVLGGTGESFIDKYLEWAVQCTDSPKQYHVAGALTILSVLLSPYIRLSTSFGDFRCNLWFIILAGTTMTRKTTAMEMAIKLAECIEPEVVLSTDGSSEGIVSALSGRDGSGSLQYIDEVNGFIEQTIDKRYMSGLMQTLTRLYDGGKVKRTLRSNTIRVDDPYFCMLTGGIKSKTIELLDIQHIMSGFIPRFLAVCGWTRKEDTKPIGPPSQSVPLLRDGLVTYLEDLVKKYAPPVQRLNLNGHVRKPIAVIATDAAWVRMRKLEEDVHELGLTSSNPDMFCPLYERLMNSIIKVAVLISADRAYRERMDPVLDVQDLLSAISYADVWIESMCEVASGIDDKPSKGELRFMRVEEAILNSDKGLTRSDLMRRFRLTAREVTEIEATLIGRGLVGPTLIGRATVYRRVVRED
jgi:hypothetical protein